MPLESKSPGAWPQLFGAIPPRRVTQVAPYFASMTVHTQPPREIDEMAPPETGGERAGGGMPTEIGLDADEIDALEAARVVQASRAA